MKRNVTKINKLFLLPLLVLMLIGGCGKYGEFGPPGDPGPKGDAGSAGADGSTILNGEGAPGASLGKAGDFYIDIKSANFYGPKSASGWDRFINLGTKGETGAPGKDGANGKDGADGKDGTNGSNGTNGADGQDGTNGKDGADGKDGANGADGKDGSQIFSGMGTPPASLGNASDYFIDFENLTVYGPKVSDNDWGTGISAHPADLNGVKTVIMKDMKFPNEVTEQRAGNSVEKSLRSTVIPTFDYQDYYEDGMVMAFVKDPSVSDAAWTGEHAFYKEDFSFGAVVKTSKILFGKENIVMQMTELNTDIPYAKENYMVDVKFVLIPSERVEAMKAQNLNLKDAKAVAKFLKL